MVIIGNMESIIQTKRECLVCGLTATLHRHHVFFGVSNRKKSEEDGCWVWLCHHHHNGSKDGVHFNMKLDKQIKRLSEEKWLNYYNKTIDDFIQRYGRNYL